MSYKAYYKDKYKPILVEKNPSLIFLNHRYDLITLLTYNFSNLRNVLAYNFSYKTLIYENNIVHMKI